VLEQTIQLHVHYSCIHILLNDYSLKRRCRRGGFYPARFFLSVGFVSHVSVTFLLFVLVFVLSVVACRLFRGFHRLAWPRRLVLPDTLVIDQPRTFLHVFRQLRRSGDLFVTWKDIAGIETLGLAAIAQPGWFRVRLSHLVLRLVPFPSLRFPRHQYQPLVRRVSSQHPQGHVARHQLGVHQIQVTDAATTNYRIAGAHRTDADDRGGPVDTARLRPLDVLLVAEAYQVFVDLTGGRLGVHVTGIRLAVAYVTLGILGMLGRQAP